VEEDRGAVAAASGVDFDDVGAAPGRDRDAVERVLAGVARSRAMRDDESGHGSGATRTSAASAWYTASAGPSSSGRSKLAMIRSAHSMSV